MTDDRRAVETIQFNTIQYFIDTPHMGFSVTICNQINIKNVYRPLISLQIEPYINPRIDDKIDTRVRRFYYLTHLSR